MRRVFGVIAIIIGIAGLAAAACTFAGIVELPDPRGQFGLLGISAVFLYVGWNWIQDKVAH